ncbi:MAG TPA: DinB family protein [Vicinamibacterales bacterium]|nr:DinB family protein [Vicinamibacterales bacterium]
MAATVRAGACAAILLTLTLPSSAQTRDGLMGDLIKDVTDVEKKVVSLARAMPAEAHAWRPGKGVRSTGEVLAHIAADNYFMPAAMSIAAPAETGITKEYKTAAAFEKRTMTRDQVIAEVEKSFAFLKKSMEGVADAQLNAPLEIFGQKTTSRSMWISTATHLHEHLGQLIAYARSNNVTPPWSK